MTGDPESSVWVVVGLGNPGPAYEGNRHNAGAMVVRDLARSSDAALRRHRTHASVGSMRLAVSASGHPGQRVVLAIPGTYMNESGRPVRAVLSYFGVKPHGLIVVHDDLDIPFGEVRLKLGGGDGGHNGLRSISQALDTREYHRVRVGIGRPPGRMDPAAFVLKDFNTLEAKSVPLIVDEAADAVIGLVINGLDATQRRHHAPRS